MWVHASPLEPIKSLRHSSLTLTFIPTPFQTSHAVFDIIQVLHVANHVLSMLTQTGERGLPAALEANDPAAFEGGEGALLRCVEELVTCIRISERDTLARLICRCVSPSLADWFLDGRRMGW